VTLKKIRIMNAEEHKKYLKEFKAFAREIVSSREKAQEFLIKAGINTETGELTEAYSPNGKK